MKSQRRYIILDYIVDYMYLNQYAPTNREIAAAVGLNSSSTVSEHLHKLRAEGLVDFINKEPRTITVLDELSMVKVLAFNKSKPHIIELAGKEYILQENN